MDRSGDRRPMPRRGRRLGALALSKSKKNEESIHKRRTYNPATDEGVTKTTNKNDPILKAELANVLPTLRRYLFTDSYGLQLNATVKYRKLLSQEHDPPIQQVIDSDGVVRRLIEFLSSRFSKLQFESAWALTNLASGSPQQTQVIIDEGALPPLIKLLTSPVPDVREQAVWAIGNIAGDNTALRDRVLEHNAMAPLISILEAKTERLTMVRNAVWTLSNLCRGKDPSPDMKYITAALKVMPKLAAYSDEDILVNTCWALAYIGDGSNERIQAVIDSGVCPRVIELLKHPSRTVRIPALRCVGNLVTGDDDAQTQAVLDNDALPALRHVMMSKEESLRKEACWTISNITAGSPSQVQAVFDAGIIPFLLHILFRGDIKSRKEACWAICNATSSARTHPDLVRTLVKAGSIGPLCNMLTYPENKILLVTLDALDNILFVGEMDKMNRPDRINMYAMLVDECGGMETIHGLQSHESTEIYEKSYHIIDKYFADEDEEEEQEALLALATAQQLQQQNDGAAYASYLQAVNNGKVL